MTHSVFKFNRDQILRPYRFNLNYAKDLVVDVTDDQLYYSPGPGLENHPGFTLGHLVTASAMVAEDLGESYDVPDVWDDLFRRNGPGDPRLPESKSINLPSKLMLLEELEHKHALVEDRVRMLDDDRFDRPVEWRFENYFPTVGDMLNFMCISHEAMHLAQVAAWRRACGLESSLARL